MNEWWGYLHTDGSIHAKRYFDFEDLTEATGSPFVDRVYGPFKCASSAEAVAMLRKHFAEAGGGD
jgi:hypothetical protein